MVDLSRFDATTFQDLAANLAVAEFSAEVRPMGAGRDGGRDLICESEIAWTTPGVEGEQRSSGYTVLQVKHMQKPSDDHQVNAAWLWEQVRDELDAWAEKPDRQRTPQTLIFVTNIALTPFPTSGGFDSLRNKIGQYVARLDRIAKDERDEESKASKRAAVARLRLIQKFFFWDYYQIKALVGAHPGVRYAHNAFLTVGDVLAAIPSLLNLVPEEGLVPALRSHARTTLVTGGRIYFDEAGALGDTGMPVHRVMVDLPATVTDESGTTQITVLPYILRRSGRMLKPKTTRVDRPRHLVVSGAPGNGKTTLSKMIVQAHRAAFLRGNEALSEDQRVTIEQTDQALLDLGIAPPSYPRWPIQVNLAEFAQDDAIDLQSTLIRRIAREVSRKSDVGDIAPSLLARWRSRWPWLVVLDGFDEVVDPTLRKRIIEQITEFANDCEAEDCDMLIVLTTRPLGFVEDIGDGIFEHLQLSDLSPSTALAYGEKVTAVRLAAGPDRRDQVIRRLREATADEAYRNLLKTPLQVLIFSIIVEQAGELAPDRFSLFDGYFNTVLIREKGKPGGFSSLIRDHGSLIERIHQRVGIELQVRAEQISTTHSVISAQELHDIIWTALKEDEFEPERRDRQLLQDIAAAATHRLVLLAPHGDDGYGFDVRLLQEYMAGQYLAAATDAVVAARLRLAAPNPHWRQTWLFAAGKMFDQPAKHLQELVVKLTETIDDNAPQRLGRVFPVGPQLAMDILIDGMSRARPIWSKRLVERALDLLENPGTAPIKGALAFVRLASLNDNAARTVTEGLRSRLETSARSAIVAVLGRWAEACNVLEAPLQVRAIAHVKPAVQSAAVTGVRPATAVPTLTPDEQRLFDAVIPSNDTPRGQLRALRAGLAQEPVARALEATLYNTLSRSSRLHSAIERDVIARELRRPIGLQLLAYEEAIE